MSRSEAQSRYPSRAVVRKPAPPRVRRPINLIGLQCPIHVVAGEGRGIVIPGGGIYLKSAWVTVRMVRHFGCDLPIELWMLPWETISDSERAAFVSYGVRIRQAAPGYCLDESISGGVWAASVWLAGWQLKVQAVLQSDFREVVFLDADCYPIETGWLEKLTDSPYVDATFLGDIRQSSKLLKTAACAELGLERGIPVDSGAFYVVKGSGWEEIVGILNGPQVVHDTYSLFWGDKDTWWAAHELAGVPFRVMSAGVAIPGFLGIRHGIGLIHRTGCKFVDGDPQNTPQKRPQGIEGDQVAVSFLKSWPPMHVRNARDSELIASVLEGDEYGLSQRKKAEWIVDAGAHIGSFTVAALRRWPTATVLAIEPDPDNCRLFRLNQGSGIWLLHEAALGEVDGRADLAADSGDTAYHTVEGDAVQVLKLSSLLEIHQFPRVDLLKMDIEGDELAVIRDLVVSGWIDKVGDVCGEWHTTEVLFAAMDLLRKTHHVKVNLHHWNHGYFEATRNDQ